MAQTRTTSARSAAKDTNSICFMDEEWTAGPRKGQRPKLGPTQRIEQRSLLGKMCSLPVSVPTTSPHAFQKQPHPIYAPPAKIRITTLVRPNLTSMKRARAHARRTSDRSELGCGGIWHEQVMTPCRNKLPHMHALCTTSTSPPMSHASVVTLRRAITDYRLMRPK